MVVLSSICVVSSTYAWFVANTHVTAGVGNISVTNTRKLKYTAILYRSDGVYFDCQTALAYNQDGTNYTDFSMLEYDFLITENNLLNNLIMRVTVSEVQISGVFTNYIKTSNSTWKSSVTDGATTKYALSDVIGVSSSGGEITGIDLTSSLDIYEKGTALFNNSTPTKFVTLNTVDTTQNPTKVSSISFSNYNTDEAIFYFNISFIKSLVDKINPNEGSSIENINKMYFYADLEFSLGEDDAQ